LKRLTPWSFFFLSFHRQVSLSRSQPGTSLGGSIAPLRRPAPFFPSSNEFADLLFVEQAPNFPQRSSRLTALPSNFVSNMPASFFRLSLPFFWFAPMISTAGGLPPFRIYIRRRAHAPRGKILRRNSPLEFFPLAPASIFSSVHSLAGKSFFPEFLPLSIKFVGIPLSCLEFSLRVVSPSLPPIPPFSSCASLFPKLVDTAGVRFPPPQDRKTSQCQGPPLILFSTTRGPKSLERQVSEVSSKGIFLLIASSIFVPRCRVLS